MTLIDKIKAFLGLDDSRSDSRDRDVDVTVEREGPDAGDGTGEQAAGTEESSGTEAASSSTDVDTADDASSAETDTTDDTDSAEADATDDGGSAGEEQRVPSEAVDVIKGIGPTYADRLSNAGVETVADLADADADEISQRADVPRGRLEDWIQRARTRNR